MKKSPCPTCNTPQADKDIQYLGDQVYQCPACFEVLQAKKDKTQDLIEEELGSSGRDLLNELLELERTLTIIEINN